VDTRCDSCPTIKINDLAIKIELCVISYLYAPSLKVLSPIKNFKVWYRFTVWRETFLGNYLLDAIEKDAY
jgi:hypothetical protein